MKNKKFITIMKSIAVISTIGFSSATLAATKPVPEIPHLLSVSNDCKVPISVYVDDNFGTVYKGYHNYQPGKGEILTVSARDSDEAYTFTYKNAVCVVDYKNWLSLGDYTLYVTFSGSETAPKCEVSRWPWLAKG